MLLIEFERRRAGLTQGALGERVGCSRVIIGRYERGDYMPRKERAEAIAKVLGWPAEDAHLLFEEIQVV